MRKALVMFLIIGLLAFIVACNPDSSLNEELVNVTISSRDTRALEASTNFNINDVRTWKYTAKKADNGLKTGETTEQVELIDGKTQQLSQGSWNFELFGYNGEGNLICSGKTTDPTTITIEKHTITIQVGALTTAGVKGKIVIAKDIKIVDKDGNSVADESATYTKTVTVRDSKGEEVTKLDEVPSGVYSVEVVYTGTAKDGTTYTAASEKKYFNVFDNLTTTVSGNIKELTQAGEPNPEEGKVVASVGGKLYTSIADALKEATVDAPLILTSDATLKEFVSLGNSAVIDLNGNTLSTEDVSISLPSATTPYTVTVKNGFIKGDSNMKNMFQQETNSKLILDNVKIEHKGQTVAFICEGSNPVWLELRNSTIENDGYYGISTNARLGTDHVYINVDNSKVTTKQQDQDATAILFNVPGELKISNSEINGQRHGVIVRGEKATISNSTIISSGKKIDGYDYSDGSWGTGNRVPLAALVIGNRDTSGYSFGKTVTLDNVTLSTPNDSKVRKSIYVYQSNENEKVTVTGTINGEYTINDNLNGAVVFPERIQFDDSLNDTFNDTLANTVSKSAIVELKEGSSFSLKSGVCNEGSKSKNVTFIGELDADNKPVSTINVAEKAVVTEGAKHLSFQRGSTFTFENLVIENGTDTYDGIVCDELIYKNCVIKGVTTLYGKATFINCTFKNDMDNQYSIWTWGGTDVTFEGCTFNTNGKAILMFGEEKKTTLNVSNCTFNDRKKGAAGKAAIEVGDAHYGKHNTFTLNINKCTVNDFAINQNGTNTNTTLWANKDSMDAAHLSVTIDGKKIQ